MSGSTISITKNEPGTETICLEFTNGQDTKTLNQVIKEKCISENVIKTINSIQIAAAYSDIAGKFSLESP